MLLRGTLSVALMGGGGEDEVIRDPLNLLEGRKLWGKKNLRNRIKLSILLQNELHKFETCFVVLCITRV